MMGIDGRKLPFPFCCEVHVIDQYTGILLTLIPVIVTVWALSCHFAFIALSLSIQVFQAAEVVTSKMQLQFPLRFFFCSSLLAQFLGKENQRKL